jgi:hypothetical protein
MIRPLIEADIKMLPLWDAETQRAPGGANNPSGNNQYSLSESVVNVDNVHVDHAPERPTGNTEQAGLRRLRKAAEAGEGRP